jgi:hypothetical protein
MRFAPHLFIIFCSALDDRIPCRQSPHVDDPTDTTFPLQFQDDPPPSERGEDLDVFADLFKVKRMSTPMGTSGIRVESPRPSSQMMRAAIGCGAARM